MGTQADQAPSCTSAREQLAALAAAYAADPEREAPYARLRRVRPPVGDRPARSASVLVLFGSLDGKPAEHASPSVPAELDVLLVVRASTLRDHAGEIAFPGGGADPEDAGAVATALREAVEETGLEPTGVEVLGALPLAPTVSNFTVTPVVAWWRAPSAVGVVDAGESAAVFRMPVADLLNPERRCLTVLERGGVEWTMPAFRTEHGLLWGFTAAILDGLFEELGWTEPWDQGDRLRPPGY
ncbi:MAG: CoA pyrophosphatase [Arthrobacter sp.]|jgi:8-oxo-dGTP pyrophosphatase MutT (NUDIX family)|nr:CoA pyrophosphatase [Arthrobacter sp.]